MMITAQTRLVGVIGFPIAHTLSPVMHNAAFAALKLDWVYLPLVVPPEQLRAALQGLVALGFAGANLTIPHKTSALAHLDDLSPEAKSLGAVNTVVVAAGRLIGYNTDATGFLAALDEAGCRPHHALVLGAGGAAHAVVYALRQRGVSVTIGNRRPKPAAWLAEKMGAAFLPTWDAFTLSTALTGVDLLVNATPVGQWPVVNESPLPAGVQLPSHLTVFDLVYNPPHTRLLQQARQAGAKTISGLGMLVHQGAAAFSLWTGYPPPTEVMRRAVLAGLG